MGDLKTELLKITKDQLSKQFYNLTRKSVLHEPNQNPLKDSHIFKENANSTVDLTNIALRQITKKQMAKNRISKLVHDNYKHASGEDMNNDMDTEGYENLEPIIKNIHQLGTDTWNQGNSTTAFNGHNKRPTSMQVSRQRKGFKIKQNFVDSQKHFTHAGSQLESINILTGGKYPTFSNLTSLL